MKKALLCIAICAGAISVTATIILCIMCGESLLVLVKRQAEKLVVTGKKAGERFERIIHHG